MRILLDECVPRRLKFHLSGHECVTVPEAGFSGKRNGELLRLAESCYDAFITLDKGIPYQQNLAGTKLRIVIIRAQSNRLLDLLPHAAACLAVLQSITPGEVIRVG
jgi:predicted nuclease of predicted toxin-antitoxin system